MLVEVSTAVNYIVSHLYNKLPRRRVDMLADELDRCVKVKCQGHWFPDQPMKGTAYRCLRVSGEHADPVMYQAARESGMDIGEIFSCLPDDLTLWLDPGQVSYRVGEKGLVRVLLAEGSTSTNTTSQQQQHQQQNSSTYQPILTEFIDSGVISSVSPELSLTTQEFMSVFPPPPLPPHSEPVTPECHPGLPNMSNFRPALDNLSASFGQVTLYPGSGAGESGMPWSTSTSPTNAPMLGGGAGGGQQQPGMPGSLQSYYLQKSISTPNFTAASFAQTKFGSTKLKAPGAKRQNRLSPSEMGNYMGAAQPACVSPPGQRSNQFTSPTGTMPPNFVNRSLSLSPSVSQTNTSHHHHSGINNGTPYDIPLILPPNEMGGDTGGYLPPHLDPNFPMNTCFPAASSRFCGGDQFHSATSSPEFSCQFSPSQHAPPNIPPGLDVDGGTGVDGDKSVMSVGGANSGRGHDSTSPGTPGYQQLLLAN